MQIKFKMKPMVWFAILTIIAVALALGLPPDPQVLHQLHTSSAAYRLAIAALLIPYILIWYASFYAFSKLLDYSRPLKKSKDGAAFSKLAFGMGVLAFSLVVPTIISLVLNNIATHVESFHAAATIINNYIGLFPVMLAFLLLYNGARTLLQTTSKWNQRVDLRWHSPWFLLLAVLFTYLTIQNQYRTHPYHLAIWLLIVTFIVPYLYGWLVGLLSAYSLHVYSRSVRGSLYRRAIRQFAGGITVTIMGSIAIQFINITLIHRIDNSLLSVLLIDYCLIVIVVVGLALMAFGTKKLKRLEEI